MATLLPFLVIIIAFWFLLIRPQQKRARQAREMQSALAPGDRVMLTSGFFGEVTAIDDDGVRVDIADGVVVKVVRNAVGQVLPREDASGEGEDLGDEATGASDADAPADHDSGVVDLDKSSEQTTEPTTEHTTEQGTEHTTESAATRPGSEENI